MKVVLWLGLSGHAAADCSLICRLVWFSDGSDSAILLLQLLPRVLYFKSLESIVVWWHWLGRSLRPGKLSNSPHGAEGATRARRVPFPLSTIPASLALNEATSIVCDQAPKFRTSWFAHRPGRPILQKREILLLTTYYSILLHVVSFLKPQQQARNEQQAEHCVDIQAAAIRAKNRQNQAGKVSSSELMQKVCNLLQQVGQHSALAKAGFFCSCEILPLEHTPANIVAAPSLKRFRPVWLTPSSAHMLAASQLTIL